MINHIIKGRGGDMSQVEKRFATVKKELIQRTKSAGRNLEDIKIIAVSKGQALTDIQQLADKKSISAFGESRVQELRDKNEQLPDLSWHMIGHLQRNKVKYLARMDNCSLIHSLDSYRLAKKIDKRARMEDRDMSVLVQVNIAKDENKYGIMPEETTDFIKQVAEFDNLSVKGLMTILPHVEDSEELRPYFASMKELFEQIKKMDIIGVEMKELSMGMSNDYKVAIEEGATMLRLGRAIFGSRAYN